MCLDHQLMLLLQVLLVLLLILPSWPRSWRRVEYLPECVFASVRVYARVFGCLCVRVSVCVLVSVRVRVCVLVRKRVCVSV